MSQIRTCDHNSKNYVYVGSYTGFKPGDLGWVGSTQPGKGILFFLFDNSEGKLIPTGKVIQQDSPTWLEVHPNQRFLIATHELSHHSGFISGAGFVTSYKIMKDGNLMKINTQSTAGLGNTCATFDRTGRFLFVTCYWEGGVSVLPFDPETGIIGELTAHVEYEGSGSVPLRQTMSHPHGVFGDPGGNLVFVMDLGTDMIHQHILNQKTGELTLKNCVELDRGSGPRGLKFHPSINVAYVNCELNGSIVVCTMDHHDGLIPIQTVHGYPDGYSARDKPENLGKSDYWGAEGCLSVDGSYYYYICRVHQSIAVFAIDPINGKLNFSNRFPLTANSNARNLTIDPNGNYLLVASQDADCVECFRINPVDGALELTHTEFAPCAADVAII